MIARRSRAVPVLLALALTWAYGCGLGWHRPPAEPEVVTATAAAARSVRETAQGRSLTWLGVREEGGSPTPSGELLDRYLVSALIAEGLDVIVPDSAATGGFWGKEEPVPERVWRSAAAGSLALAGRIHHQGAWEYLQLVLIDPAGGTLAGSTTQRLRGSSVQRLMAGAGHRDDRKGEAGPLVLEVHRLGVRTEGGLTRPVAIEPEALLQAGDRLQVRVRTRQDCEVWAFLYSSAGEMRELLSSRRIFAGRWECGPGQDAWVTLGEGIQVYTLYLVAGSHLAEDREEVWERMGELIEQGQVVRYTGLELLDRVLVDFLVRGMKDGPTMTVIRQGDRVRPGGEESFILDDGTPLSNRAEELSGSPLVIRAVSFAVQ